jgi:hypothetical protein
MYKRNLKAVNIIQLRDYIKVAEKIKIWGYKSDNLRIFCSFLGRELPMPFCSFLGRELTMPFCSFLGRELSMPCQFLMQLAPAALPPLERCPGLEAVTPSSAEDSCFCENYKIVSS